jgi:4a-hydroxytetrahydrobiopterin dehydratase
MSNAFELPPFWEINTNGQLERTFVFQNFDQALEFFNLCAGIAQKANHHPDLFLHNWNKLTITLFTHSEKTVTNKDYQMAQDINSL